MDIILKTLYSLQQQIDNETFNESEIADVKKSLIVCLNKLPQGDATSGYLLDAKSISVPPYSEMWTDLSRNEQFQNAKASLLHLVKKVIFDLSLEEQIKLMANSGSKASHNKNITDLDALVSSAKSKLEAVVQQEKELALQKEAFVKTTEAYDEIKSAIHIAGKLVDFSKAANKHRVAARWWLVVATVLFIIFICLLLRNLSNTNSFSSVYEDVSKSFTNNKQVTQVEINTVYFTYYKKIFTTILLYSTCIYLLVVCVKNYNARIHNSIINEHRSNALVSALNLLNTPLTDEGKAKVFTQATEAIFSHQPTGYSGKESDAPSPNVVTNVIDTFGKKV